VRGNHAGTFQVQYRPTGTSTWTTLPEANFGDSTVDYTAVVTVGGLDAGTSYDYRVSVGCLVDHLGQAGFRTLPPSTASTIRFAYAADLRQPSAFLTSTSQRQKHYPLFADLAGDNPALMILGGDQIYGDAGSFVPQTPADYYRTYRENWGEVFLRSAMGRVPSLMMWDDHEILNNWDDRTADPYAAASTAFDAYQGSHNPAPFRPGVKYYAFRAGPADFFVTDDRTYRSQNSAPDDSGKTMLGATQLADLESWLATSTATFKFIVTSDPFADMNCDLSTPNHDSWCGFRTERQKLFDFVASHDIRGVVAISGDHHWSGAFRGDNTTAKIYEFMPNPMGNEPATAPSSAPDMLWHYGTPQEVYGLFDVDTSVSPATLTVRFKGTGGAVLRTFVVDENGGITQF
jgi:phosphodiesterase/alkaline phosphatase D-like protein